MRFGILIFIALFGVGASAVEFSQEQINCYRRVNPHTELTESERRIILRTAQRFHHDLKGRWGQGVELSRGYVVANTIQVVVRFQQRPKNFEIVVLYDYEAKKVIEIIAPDRTSKGIHAYELE